MTVRHVNSIQVACHACGARVIVRRAEKGHKYRCPKCDGPLNVRVQDIPAGDQPEPPLLAEAVEELAPAGESLPICELVPDDDDGEFRIAPALTLAERMPAATLPAIKPLMKERPPSERTELPELPLVNGVFRFLEYPSLWHQVFWMAFGPTVVWLMLLFVGFTFGAMAYAFMGILTIGMLALLIVPCASYVAGTLTAVLEETAAGADEIEFRSSLMLFHWQAIFCLLVAGILSAAPGAIVSAATQGAMDSRLAIAISMWLLLPCILLAQLDGESVFNVVGADVWRSMWLAPGTWLGFYALTIALAVTGYLAVALALMAGWPGLLLGPPLVTSVGLMIYFRLLGRLAWACAERLEEPEEDDDAQDM